MSDFEDLPDFSDLPDLPELLGWAEAEGGKPMGASYGIPQSLLFDNFDEDEPYAEVDEIQDWPSTDYQYESAHGGVESEERQEAEHEEGEEEAAPELLVPKPIETPESAAIDQANPSRSLLRDDDQEQQGQGDESVEFPRSAHLGDHDTDVSSSRSPSVEPIKPHPPSERAKSRSSAASLSPLPSYVRPYEVDDVIDDTAAPVRWDDEGVEVNKVDDSSDDDNAVTEVTPGGTPLPSGIRRSQPNRRTPDYDIPVPVVRVEVDEEIEAVEMGDASNAIGLTQGPLPEDESEDDEGDESSINDDDDHDVEVDSEEAKSDTEPDNENQTSSNESESEGPGEDSDQDMDEDDDDHVDLGIPHSSTRSLLSPPSEPQPLFSSNQEPASSPPPPASEDDDEVMDEDEAHSTAEHDEDATGVNSPHSPAYTSPPEASPVLHPASQRHIRRLQRLAARADRRKKAEEFYQKRLLELAEFEGSSRRSPSPVEDVTPGSPSPYRRRRHHLRFSPESHQIDRDSSFNRADSDYYDSLHHQERSPILRASSIPYYKPSSSASASAAGPAAGRGLYQFGSSVQEQYHREQPFRQLHTSPGPLPPYRLSASMPEVAKTISPKSLQRREAARTNDLPRLVKFARQLPDKTRQGTPFHGKHHDDHKRPHQIPKSLGLAPGSGFGTQMAWATSTGRRLKRMEDAARMGSLEEPSGSTPIPTFFPAQKIQQRCDQATQATPADAQIDVAVQDNAADTLASENAALTDECAYGADTGYDDAMYQGELFGEFNTFEDTDMIADAMEETSPGTNTATLPGSITETQGPETPQVEVQVHVSPAVAEFDVPPPPPEEVWGSPVEIKSATDPATPPEEILTTPPSSGARKRASDEDLITSPSTETRKRARKMADEAQPKSGKIARTAKTATTLILGAAIGSAATIAGLMRLGAGA